jgi:hypothetical protein
MGRAANKNKAVANSFRRSQVLAELLGLPTELVPVPDRAQAEELYNYFHAPSGIKVVLEEYQQNDEERIYAKGVLKRGRKRVGEWQRDLGTYRQFQLDGVAAGDPRLVATNSWLEIYDEANRYRGFGRAYSEELERRYRELGVHRIHLWATKEGCYVWARCGYRFETNSLFYLDAALNSQPSLSEAAEAANMWCSPLTQQVVEELVEVGKVTPQLVQASSARFLTDDPQLISAYLLNEGALTTGANAKEIKRQRAQAAARMATHPIATPAEFAALGEEESWEEDGVRMWLGKAVLMSPGYAKCGWRGYKVL